MNKSFSFSCWNNNKYRNIKLDWFGEIVFTLSFVAMFFYYGLHETMFDPPQSVHVWRQTNSISLAQNYYQHDLPLLEPEMHNQFGNDGLSGKAVGEFPIIYYSVAKLWKLFGNHTWIFKLVQNIILFTGLFSLYLALIYILKNRFWAGFVSLLIFTSPMVVFYGPNFLPDVPALSFVFIAWYFIARYSKSRKGILRWLSALFFCLSMLLKITSAISFIALGGWAIFELIFMRDDQQIFKFKLKHFLPFLLAVVPVIAWYVYADYYNSINKGHFSHHGIWPIWNMTKEDFLRIIDIQDKIFFKQLFLPYLQYFTLLIWTYLVIKIKRLHPVSRYFVLVLPAGFLAQVLLWFHILDYHDYYLINLIVVLVAIWAVFLAEAKKIKAKTYVRFISYGLAIGFFLWNVHMCDKHVQLRYVGWMNETFHKNYKALIDIEPSFQKWGIKEDDKVISIPDVSINTTLYYMNRKGYSDFGSDFSKPETFYWRIENGAKYLVVNDSSILSQDYLKPFIEKQVGTYENIAVFDLRGIVREKY